MFVLLLFEYVSSIFSKHYLLSFINKAAVDTSCFMFQELDKSYH